MTETKFTPGPWVAEWGQVVIDYKPTKSRIHGTGASDGFICDLNDGVIHEYYDEEEQQANAHLIAAAPDLFKALDGILDELEIYVALFGEGLFTEPVIRDAKQAIAKVRGEVYR